MARFDDARRAPNSCACRIRAARSSLRLPRAWWCALSTDGGDVTHEPRCACLVCSLRRDLSPAFWCRECESWQPYEDVPGAEARTRCEECDVSAGK
jgi:hypothetical protein